MSLLGQEEEKMLKTYIATVTKSSVVELDDKHAMLVFNDLKNTDKLFLKALMKFFPCVGIVKEMVYRKDEGVTVAILDCPYLIEAQKYCKSVGYDYNLDSIPHVTVAKGKSKSKGMSHLIGKEVVIEACYTHCKDFS